MSNLLELYAITPEGKRINNFIPINEEVKFGSMIFGISFLKNKSRALEIKVDKNNRRIYTCDILKLFCDNTDFKYVFACVHNRAMWLMPNFYYDFEDRSFEVSLRIMSLISNLWEKIVKDDSVRGRWVMSDHVIIFNNFENFINSKLPEHFVKRTKSKVICDNMRIGDWLMGLLWWRALKVKKDLHLRLFIALILEFSMLLQRDNVKAERVFYDIEGWIMNLLCDGCAFKKTFLHDSDLMVKYKYKHWSNFLKKITLNNFDFVHHYIDHGKVYHLDLERYVNKEFEHVAVQIKRDVGMVTMVSANGVVEEMDVFSAVSLMIMVDLYYSMFKHAIHTGDGYGAKDWYLRKEWVGKADLVQKSLRCLVHLRTRTRNDYVLCMVNHIFYPLVHKQFPIEVCRYVLKYFENDMLETIITSWMVVPITWNDIDLISGLCRDLLLKRFKAISFGMLSNNTIDLINKKVPFEIIKDDCLRST